MKTKSPEYIYLTEKGMITVALRDLEDLDHDKRD